MTQATAMTDNLLTVFKDLARAKELVYDKLGFDITALKADTESAEYAACNCHIGEMEMLHRTAKITPKKIGQFVTLWKRNFEGSTAPYSNSDPFHFIIIAARSGAHFGQFIFPKSILLEKGIVSGNNKEGKRGIRVYPPWDKPVSRQAEKTQEWQLRYFLEIKENCTTDLERAKILLDK